MSRKKQDISHPDKTLYPEAVLSKKDVADFEERIAEYKLPHMKDRALTFRIFPQGIEEEGFFRKRAQESYPDFIKTTTVSRHSGKEETIEMARVQHMDDLIFFAGQNVIEYHLSLSKTHSYETPEEIILDFDPSEDSFEKVRKAALALGKMLEDADIPAFVKTSGSRGVHVHIPLTGDADFNAAKKCAKAIAEKLCDNLPELTTLEQRKQNRGDKVFVDWLRNDHGMTAIAPYSLRAIKGAPIATPLTWHELENRDVTPQKYTMNNIFARLGQRDCPWNIMRQHAVSLSAVEKFLE